MDQQSAAASAVNREASGPVRSSAPPRVLKKPRSYRMEDDRPVRLVVEGLTKVFSDNPRPALDMLAKGATKEQILKELDVVVGVQNASFDVRSGEIFVIMGLSGSGKSTIIRLLNRLIEPSAGSIKLDGVDVAKMSEEELITIRRRDMSMVFQSFALMPHRTAIDNAAFGLEIAGRPKAEREQAARKALAQVGLSTFMDRYPAQMSGGMQQRVGLARALANDPTLLLMDEAFSALDPLIRTEMQDELLRLQSERSRTIIFISHDLNEAMRIGDRIAIMREGRIVQIGTPYDILSNPADDYIRTFFRDVDVSRVLRAGDVARFESENTVIRTPGDLEPAIRQLDDANRRWGYVTCSEGKLHGVVSRDSLHAAVESGDARFKVAFLDGVEPIRAGELVNTVLERVAGTECPVPVVADDGAYLGSISRTILLRTLDREH